MHPGTLRPKASVDRVQEPERRPRHVVLDRDRAGGLDRGAALGAGSARMMRTWRRSSAARTRSAIIWWATCWVPVVLVEKVFISRSWR